MHDVPIELGNIAASLEGNERAVLFNNVGREGHTVCDLAVLGRFCTLPLDPSVRRSDCVPGDAAMVTGQTLVVDGGLVLA